MNRIRIPTLSLAILLSSLVWAGGKKDLPSEPRKDPREQCEDIKGKRDGLRSLQRDRLLLALHLQGIKQEDVELLLEKSNPSEREIIGQVLITLVRTDGFLCGRKYQEHVDAMRTLKQLIGAEAQSDIHYDPNDPPGAREAAVSDPSLPATAGVRDSLYHVYERDRDANVRRAAELAYARVHSQISAEIFEAVKHAHRTGHEGLTELLKSAEHRIHPSVLERVGRAIQGYTDVVIDGSGSTGKTHDSNSEASKPRALLDRFKFRPLLPGSEEP